MKKENIILLGLGAVALFFIMKGRGMTARRRGEVFVESPEKITEEQYGTPDIETGQGGGLLETVKNVAQSVRSKIQEKRQQQVVTLPGGIRIDLKKAKQIAKQKQRQQKKASRQQARTTRKTARQEKRAIRRSARQQKVGDINVLF
jgi:hypothetical protein